MNAGAFRQRTNCHYWAVERMLGTLEGLSPEQFSKVINSSFPSLRETAAHMLANEYFLLGVLLGQDVPVPESSDVLTPEALRVKWAEVRAMVRQFVDSLGSDAWERSVTLTLAPGKELQLQAWQVLEELFIHSAYHRGQITTLLRQVGGKPVNTDPIFFYTSPGE